jgi:hypothetical protein
MAKMTTSTKAWDRQKTHRRYFQTKGSALKWIKKVSEEALARNEDVGARFWLRHNGKLINYDPRDQPRDA